MHCTTFAFGYDHRLEKITYPNGVTETITADAAGHWTNITAANAWNTLVDLDYDYTRPTPNGPVDGGVIGQRVDNITGYTTAYTRDSADRVTEAEITDLGGLIDRFTYAYDAAGNITTAGTAHTSPRDYAYDNQNRLCRYSTTCATPATHTTDANGNQLTGGGHTIAYNAKNHATTIDSVASTYADADHTEQITAGATTYTSWLMGHEGTNTASTWRHYARTPDGMLIGTSSAGVHHYYLHDGERNIIGLTNSTQARTATYQYADPYGRHTTTTGTDAAINQWRYKTGWQDPSGLIKFGARYYNPTDQRWTQQDALAGTITNSNTLNRYTYAGGNPTDNWDPTGYFFDSIGNFFSDLTDDISFCDATLISFNASSLIGISGFVGIGAITGGTAFVASAVVLGGSFVISETACD